MTTSSAIFVGRNTELTWATQALPAGYSALVKGCAGTRKRALLREVRERLAGERVCLWPAVTTPKGMVEDLAEQVHVAVGLVVPERLIPPRFRAEAERTGRVAWKRIRRSLLREPAREVLALVLESLRGREDVVLFVESLEVAPTQAAMLEALAEQVPLAAAIEVDNRRNRILRLLWRFQGTIPPNPLTKRETRALVEHWLTA